MTKLSTLSSVEKFSESISFLLAPDNTLISSWDAFVHEGSWAWSNWDCLSDPGFRDIVKNAKLPRFHKHLL